MTDTVVHLGENSPEQIAYRLMLHIADCEGISVTGLDGDGFKPADRKWIMDTYAECIRMIRQPNSQLRER